jgi:very-short-patch-repair endonuclease
MSLGPEEFVRLNRAGFDSKYEEMFVRAVLARVPTIDLAKVRCQTTFHCDGRLRRCDFTLEDEIRIAFEVDGYDKTGRGTGMTRSEFNDWLLREGCLKEQGWTLLRFANWQVVNKPERCARNIELVIQNEGAKLSGAGLAQAEALELAKLDAERMLRLAELETEVAKHRQEAATLRADVEHWKTQSHEAQARAAKYYDQANSVAGLAAKASAERDSIREDRDRLSGRALIAIAIVAGFALVAIVLGLTLSRGNGSPDREPGSTEAQPSPSLPTSLATESPNTPAFRAQDYIGKGNAFDCSDFASQAQAQAVLRLDPSDPNKLDGFGGGQRNGISCETLPAPEDRTPVPH